MTLPASRDFTASSATPLPSATVNALQDAVVGKKHGAVTGGKAPHWTYSSGVWTWTPGPGAYYVTSGGAAVGLHPIETCVGDQITGLSIRAYGDGAADCTYRLMIIDGSGNVSATISNTTDVNRAAAWGEYAPAVTSHTMAAGETLVLSVEPNAANYRVASISVTRSRP